MPEWFQIIFAGIGASAILFALALVSTVVGTWLIGPMITLMSGPIIDRFIGKRTG